MSIVSARGLSVVALTLIGLLAAPVAAQDGSRLARECVEQMKEVTAAHVERDRQFAHRTIRGIRHADENGAPAKVLTSIASEGKHRIDGNTAHGHRAIHEISMRCVNRLVEIGASEELVRAVKRAAMGSHEKLDKAAERAKHAISRALAGALGD